MCEDYNSQHPFLSPECCVDAFHIQVKDVMLENQAQAWHLSEMLDETGMASKG